MPIVYQFGGGFSSTEGKEILGGKGANLARMSALNLPVPPGFTIPTTACVSAMQLNSEMVLATYAEAIKGGLQFIEKQVGYMPLLSVRSGAQVSMPGMMDTILNVGLTKANLVEWAARIGERAALDCFRRLIQMLGETACGIDGKLFSAALSQTKAAAGAVNDSDLTVQHLKKLVARFLSIFEGTFGLPFPRTLNEQLTLAIAAVFKSWNNERAIEYRNMYNIPHDMGTAVNVQAMVFGNANDNSGSGVLFSRDPSTGAAEMMGEFLPNAQGEDVVAGIRTPLPLSAFKAKWPALFGQLGAICQQLEAEFRDMQDIEFTVQDGKLFLLQCRAGKRSARAAFRIAVDMAKENLITVGDALQRVSPEQFTIMQRPRIDDGFDTPPHVIGLPACGGIVSGVAVFRATPAAVSNKPHILITHETNPDDFAAMASAAGILTATGGATSHAAVVARAMDKPCVVGCTALSVTDDTALIVQGDGSHLVIQPGDMVSIDGATGRVWVKTSVPVVSDQQDLYVMQMLEWLFTERKLVPKSAYVVGDRSHVMVVDWFGHGVEKQFANFLAAVAPMADRSGIVLDLSIMSSFTEDCDHVLWDIGGLGSLASMSLNGLVDVLVLLRMHHAQLAGIRVIVADLAGQSYETTVNMLESRGYAVITYARTLADLFSGRPVVLSDEFIERVAGNASAIDKLRQLMAPQGGLELMTLTNSTHPGAAAFAHLGKH
jgi:pyruvate,orthophosphate dikinase